MKDYIYEILKQGGDLTSGEIVLHIAMAAVIGAFIFLSYYLSHTGTIYSKKFNVSLLVLTVLTATVMTVIGNNVALSLGMVGALSIVRFRTAVKDTRDTVYIFWTIIVGICCGVGDYLVAGVGSAAVFVLLFIFGRIKNDNRILLIIRGPRSTERKVESIVFDYFDQRAQLRVKNTTQDSLEMIYEVSRKLLDKTKQREQSITEALYEAADVEYVNLVTQNDEISS